MTMPNGPAGITPGLEWGISGDPKLGDTVRNLPERTQAAIEAEMKARRLADGNSSWTKPDGPFGALGRILGMDGKGPFDALAHRLAQALLAKPSDHQWPTLDDLLGSLGHIPQTLTEHTEAIAKLDDVSAAMGTTQAYVGDMQDMVSAPRVMLRMSGPDAEKSWDVVTPFIGTMRANLLPTHTPRTYPGQTTGDIYYAPIVVDRNGTVDKMRWIVGANKTLISVTYYAMALMVYNPSGGNLEKVWDSGNIVNGASAATNSIHEAEISMGLSQHVKPGQILAVAHQQVGPSIGAAGRLFAAVPQPGVSRPSTLLLDAASYRQSHHAQGIPSSVALSSLERENRFIPWAAISVRS